MGMGRDTDGHSDADELALGVRRGHGDRGGGDAAPDALRDRQRVELTRARYEDRDLLATQAADQVTRTDIRSQGVRYGTQDVVADHVAVAVVDVLGVRPARASADWSRSRCAGRGGVPPRRPPT